MNAQICGMNRRMNGLIRFFGYRVGERFQLDAARDLCEQVGSVIYGSFHHTLICLGGWGSCLSPVSPSTLKAVAQASAVTALGA